MYFFVYWKSSRTRFDLSDGLIPNIGDSYTNMSSTALVYLRNSFRDSSPPMLIIYRRLIITLNPFRGSLSARSMRANQSSWSSDMRRAQHKWRRIYSKRLRIRRMLLRFISSHLLRLESRATRSLSSHCRVRRSWTRRPRIVRLRSEQRRLRHNDRLLLARHR